MDAGSFVFVRVSEVRQFLRKKDDALTQCRAGMEIQRV